MGDMAAGELQDPLTTKGMLQRLFADGALSPDESPLSPGPASVSVEHSCHTAARSLAEFTVSPVLDARGWRIQELFHATGSLNRIGSLLKGWQSAS